MKKLVLALVASMLLISGCATPGYSTKENLRAIARNMDYEYKQMNEDIMTFLMLQPTGHLTRWNVR